ncbi:MAG: sulfite exporter TauE/SafE family protein [Archaeoglobaceae archaeon]
MLEEITISLLVIYLLAATSSAIVKTGTGVGAGIFLLPILSLVLDPKAALGVGAPIMLVSDIIGIRLYWKEWETHEILLIIPPSIFGVVIGVIFVDLISSAVFKYWIGVFAISYVSYYFIIRIKKNFSIFKKEWNLGRGFGIIFGFLGGFLSTISHAGGVILSIYLTAKDINKRCFVGVFVFFFLVTNTLKTFGYILVGIISFRDILIVLMLSPFIVLGGYFGNFLNKKISQTIFRDLIYIIILISGLKLFFK